MHLNSIELAQIDDTIIALATPSGMGAIAVIRLSGENAISIVSNHFKSKFGNKNLENVI